MRAFPIFVVAATALAGCAKASAAEPDSRNPAHCIAAMNFSAFWLGKNNKYPEKVTEVRARALFEAQKIKASGGSMEAAKAESDALTRAFGNDLEKMNALSLACGVAQDRDPRFKAEIPALIATVRNGWRD
jgi:hypothetical protein